MAFIIVLILFLLGLVAFVAAIVYLLLSQEKKQLLPKSIEDRVSDEIYQKRYGHLEPYLKTGKSIETGMGRLLRPFFTTQSLLLYITFGVALAITVIAVSLIMFNIAGVLLFPVLIIALPFFPTGLTAFLEQAFHYSSTSMLAYDFEMLGGWLIYITIIILGAFSKKRSFFILLYLIFITLLMMNVVGCIRSASPFCPDGC